ncbi:MAG: GTPase [Planctomycetota bacterium]|jgi:tRNA modification GTPase
MIGDTIQAVSSPPGAGARGVLRISGPEAFAVAGRMIGRGLPAERGSEEAELDWQGYKIPCLVLHMPGPNSYTGEDLIELHLPGSPLLLSMLGEELAPECRLATPGEFTRRAFENGRMDLAGAQAVMDLIHAASEADRRRALSLINGEVQAELAGHRAKIQDAQALIEAGLDFESGETGEVAYAPLLPSLAAVEADLRALAAGLPSAGSAAGILLLGAANAGKSSLCNALVGRDEVLVDAEAGSTRDLLRVELPAGGVILDSPGELAGSGWDGELAEQQREAGSLRAAAGILVLDGQNPSTDWAQPALPLIALVLSKQDLGKGPLPPGLPDLPLFRTSVRSGEGISELRQFICERSSAGPVADGSFLRDSLVSCLEHLKRAQSPELLACGELVALELGAAIAALDPVEGHSSPEDLLDRIFAGFCLGK